jgi:hypothetical protein
MPSLLSRTNRSLWNMIPFFRKKPANNIFGGPTLSGSFYSLVSSYLPKNASPCPLVRFDSDTASALANDEFRSTSEFTSMFSLLGVAGETPRISLLERV